MKKLICFITLSISIALYSLPISAATEYTDPVTNVSYNIPDGWCETALSQEREFVKKKYIPQSKDGASIVFGYSDLWSSLSESEKVGLERYNLTHESIVSTFEENDLLESFAYLDQDAPIETVTYGNNEYIKTTVDTTITIGKISVEATMITLTHFDNGYCFQFVFCDLTELNHLEEFENMIRFVNYSSSAETTDFTTDTNDDEFSWYNIILSVIVTIVIYSLPIIIYRYAILKRPVPSKEAKKITIIYAIIAFLAMTFIINGVPGAAIVFWSFVNKKILTTPTKNDIKIEDNNGSNIVNPPPILEHHNNITSINTEEKVAVITETPISKKEILYCRKCGNKLPEGSAFCNKCGNEIVNN